MKKQIEIGAPHNLPKKESSPQKLEYTLTYFFKIGISGAMTGVPKVMARISKGGKPCSFWEEP